MASEIHDIVLANGRVIDPETGLDAVRNVAIKDGKIAAVTADAITGTETIDVTGHVVAPGFIDAHSHNAGVDLGERMSLRDGATTMLELEVGVFPVGEWYDQRKGKRCANYGASVGLAPIREHILNDGYKTVESGQFLYDVGAEPAKAHGAQQWQRGVMAADRHGDVECLLDQGLAEGSVGVGCVPGYMTVGYSQQEPVISQKMAGKYGSASSAATSRWSTVRRFRSRRSWAW